MTEIVEYTLVVLVSTLFVAGSVAAYSSYSTFNAGLQFRAEFSEVSVMATQAIANGSSRATISMPASNFTCHSGTLTVISGSFSERTSVQMPCDFSLSEPRGVHTLDFSVQSSRLLLSVT